MAQESSRRWFKSLGSCTHVGDLEATPGIPALDRLAIWGTNQQIKALCLCLCLCVTLSLNFKKKFFKLQSAVCYDVRIFCLRASGCAFMGATGAGSHPFSGSNTWKRVGVSSDVNVEWNVAGKASGPGDFFFKTFQMINSISLVVKSRVTLPISYWLNVAE